MKFNWPIFVATGVLIPTFEPPQKPIKNPFDEDKPKPTGGSGMSVKKPPK